MSSSEGADAAIAGTTYRCTSCGDDWSTEEFAQQCAILDEKIGKDAGRELSRAKRA